MVFSHFLEPGAPANVKAIPIDKHTVLVAWMPPFNKNGRILHYTIYMKTMESSRGQYTRQFRVASSSLSSSSSSSAMLYNNNQHHPTAHNDKTNAFYAVRGLNEVNDVFIIKVSLLSYRKRSTRSFCS